MHHNGLKESELFLITGHTGNGKSHNPAFKAGKPHPFPLFKLHSLTPGEIVEKVIPHIVWLPQWNLALQTDLRCL